MIEPGNKVRYLNAVGGGVVSRVDGKIAYVEEEDGFETPMPLRELIVVGQSKYSFKEQQEQEPVKISKPHQPAPLAVAAPQYPDYSKAIDELKNEISHLKADILLLRQELLMLKSAPVKPEIKEMREVHQDVKKPKAETLTIIDLHSSQILETTAGMSAADILNYQIDEFRKVMDANIKNKGKKIIFIHGKGEGVLRNALMKEMRYRYKTCEVQDASFREYGFGASQVTIR